jgi:predicted TIM-barrel fold metal-dependent hydrolase
MAGRSPLREPILEPGLAIVDPHHHLWRDRQLPPRGGAGMHGFEAVIRRAPRYLPDELLADLTSGHDVRATVYIECRSMYRTDGPEHLRCVGETEFVRAATDLAAPGPNGPIRACAGVVGHADLDLGDRAAEVLDAQIAAGRGRFRGVRHWAAHDPDPDVLGPLSGLCPAGLYASDAFRAGFRHLAPRGLSFDAWLLEPQLPELIALARAFPDASIVLDHVGTPLGVGGYAGRLAERFEAWRDNIRELARSPHVTVKLGGLAMAFCAFPSFLQDPPASSEQLAGEWRPYVETCIEAFGAERCMFESNFPVDLGGADYATLWNAFKRLAAGASGDEKAALFSGTASRVYRLDA